VNTVYRRGLAFVVLVGLYLIGDLYAVHFAKGPGAFALFWPSSGLAFAVVTRYGLRWALFVPVAMLIDYVLRVHVEPIYMPFAIAGNTLGAIVGGWIARLRPLPAIADSRSGFRMLAGALVMAIIGGLIGSAGMHYGYQVPLSNLPDAFVRWSVGDLLGVVAITPAMILFLHRKRQQVGNSASLGYGSEGESLLWNIALASSYVLMAWGATAGGRNSLGLSCLPLAVMMWSALRFPPLRTAVAVSATIALIGALSGQGLAGFVMPAGTLDCVILLSYLCLLGILPITLALVVNERRAATVDLMHRVSTDPMTGLPNRGTLEIAMKRALDHTATAPQALAYLDLDNIKLVNDTASHTAGDELIKGIAGLLQANLRPGDTLAHLGGDEFALLLHNCTPTVARERAQMLVREVEAYTCEWNGRLLGATVSIGLVPFQPGETEYSPLLSQADAACFTAKELGGNRVCVAGLSQGDVLDRTVAMRWAMRIRESLERHAFSLYAQTMMPLRPDAAPGRHIELLLRMHDGDNGGLLLPGHFMPAAERFHLGVPIDRAVVGMALDWMESHPAEAATIATCAVNLCADALVDEGFIGFVAERLRGSRFPADKLCFEITETSAVRDLGRAQRFINQLRALGCRFALDDFGTGFCSFNYLRSLDVDYFKIDGSFVREMDSSPLAAAVVMSITQIAHVLDKRTIAEHTENQRQRAALIDLGVDFAQGYAIDRPQPLSTYFA
jgi:diguanylate cyclase (GGDEF)-like protein